MTRILKDDHLCCGDSRWWAFDMRFVVRRRWQCLGVCTCRDSEHCGHAVTVSHHACGHRREIEEKKVQPQRTRRTQRKR
jgi:hypothetical protein